jgi:divalent metal cation (Fe/Co/Zn/Cd) transporter
MEDTTKKKASAESAESKESEHTGEEEHLIDRVARGIRKARITEVLTTAGEVTGEAVRGLMSGRVNVLMVRINREVMEKIDNLVDAGMVRSRSEGAAFLIAVGISSQEELFKMIEKKIAQIHKIRDELKDMVEEKVKESGTCQPRQAKKAAEGPEQEA